MNEEDMHDILEKINEKELARKGMREMAQNLGAFRDQLSIEGFSEIESFALTTSFLVATLAMNQPRSEK